MLPKMRKATEPQKQKLIAMVEPPQSYGDTKSEDNITGNRMQQRRHILNELDLIKIRINQVIYTIALTYICIFHPHGCTYTLKFTNKQIV